MSSYSYRSQDGKNREFLEGLVHASGTQDKQVGSNVALLKSSIESALTACIIANTPNSKQMMPSTVLSFN